MIHLIIVFIDFKQSNYGDVCPYRKQIVQVTLIMKINR